MNRSLVIMVAVAGALVVLVLLLANPFRDNIRSNPRTQTLFDGASVRNADKLEIESGATPTVLEKRDGVWVVASENGFPADTAAVGAALRAVENAESGTVVSTNPGNQGLFQVDSTGVGVTVYSGGKGAAHFTVGKMGQDFTTSYVRPAGSRKVYVVRGMNRNMFARSRGFRDLTLLRFDPNQVASVMLAAPGGEGWTLARSDSAWTVAAAGGKPVPADRQAVDRLTGSLSNLSADGFAGGADTVHTGLTPPDTVVTVSLMNGGTLTLDLGGRNAQGQRYASRPDRSAVYVLGQWRIEAFAKNAADLAAGPATAPTPIPASGNVKLAPSPVRKPGGK